MLPFPEETIFGGIEAVAEGRRHESALVGDGGTWTYGELLERSRSLAGGLATLGIETGDTIAVWLSNSPEWIITQLAASYLDAAVVSVNTRYRTHELEYMLSDADCRVIVTESSFLDTDYLAMLADVVPSIRNKSPDTFDPEGFALTDVIAVDDTNGFEAVRHIDSIHAAPTGSRATDPDAPAAVFYTSGTTGDPKGCLQSSRSLLNHSANAAAHIGVDSSDTVVGVLPFPGVWGYNTWLGTLARGGTLVCQRHFDAERTAELCAAHGATVFPGQAVMYDRMLETGDRAWTESLDRGVICFLTMNYDRDTLERIEKTVDIPLVQPYGLSEGNSQVFVGRPSDPFEERARVGGPLVSPEIDAKVVDPETGEERPEGEKGELLLRGYNVMEGYLGKPEATAETLDEDGWLLTGDLCSIAGEYVEFHARIDDALRVRGFLVSPRDIETAIDSIPGVAQSQVVGTPHDRHGTVPVAFVRLDESTTGGSTPVEATLEAELKGTVADYKRPEHIEIVDSFPRTEGPHGAKVQKHELEERAANIL
ncbi:MAG: class I adenylate-forming enzyme family protein [Natronomonas sp.]